MLWFLLVVSGKLDDCLHREIHPHCSQPRLRFPLQFAARLFWVVDKGIGGVLSGGFFNSKTADETILVAVKDSLVDVKL